MCISLTLKRQAEEQAIRRVALRYATVFSFVLPTTYKEVGWLMVYFLNPKPSTERMRLAELL